MSDLNGTFVWYELLTTDATAAEAFYAAVLGWTMQDAGMPDMHYSMLNVGNVAVGGLMAMPSLDAGVRPGWTGYIAVDDVDGYVARVQQAGGAVHKPADDIPGVGRFAIMADPQGAVFALFGAQPELKQASPVSKQARPDPGAAGMPGWRELHAADWPTAFQFYADLFGWHKAEAVDMGPMGVYQLFATGAEPVGGMMTKFDSVPAPHWLYYFNVDTIDAAASRVTANAGRVVNGPHQVPGGSWIVQCLDPQGAMFALVAMRK